MRLLHYTERPFTFDRTRTYYQNGHHKPHGMWLSVEGEHDWPSWCEGEQWGLERLKYGSEVTLSQTANILLIDSLEKLDEFNAKHGRGDWLSSRDIDWAKVIPLYDGIVIAPYQWERRLGLMWYYTWDCASGVIWNLSAIADVAPAEAEGVR